MMQMGLTDFDSCLAALEANQNNLDNAINCFFQGGMEE